MTSLSGLWYTFSDRIKLKNPGKADLPKRRIFPDKDKEGHPMPKNSFLSVAASEGNPRYEALTRRPEALYSRRDDIRTPFSRDYTRILHCQAFRRLKHKTQVFYHAENDHICTRMEHVLHVESVSSTICAYLGLNADLARAISLGHDLGHSPFGHGGEEILRDLSVKALGEPFWHERNGLHLVDDLELLEDDRMVNRNLNLTYAVRDGILSHCGETDENALRPREDLIDLADFTLPGQFQSATWEGCVVKLSDKIAYLGRDIEDAVRLGFLPEEKRRELLSLADETNPALNTTVIIHNMITDICRNSTPERGICLSETRQRQMDSIKRFNYENIYENPRFHTFKLYSRMILEQIFEQLLTTYEGEDTIRRLMEKGKAYPCLFGEFGEWLARYCDIPTPGYPWSDTLAALYQNRKVYQKLADKKTYARAILDYISGMTDSYAIRAFEELIRF